MNTTCGKRQFEAAMNCYVRAVHRVALKHEFWASSENDGEKIALMHTELSEALEELRQLDVDWGAVGEELADCVIRIMDFAGRHRLNLGRHITKKHEINRTRPIRHGKRF